MEARRLERQRRDSAKMSAAETLPSTQDKQFHFRLIELYEQHPCLWNTTLKEHENAELKRQAWEEISKQLGAHLSPSLVRSRISSMRYRLNVYKLQMIEYRMSPASCKKPEKLYFIDRFDFLDAAHRPHQEETPEPAHEGPISGPSIASIFKKRLGQQTHLNELPDVLQRLSQSSRSRSRIAPTEPPQDSDDSSISSAIGKRLNAGSLLPERSNEPLLDLSRRLEESRQQRQAAAQPQQRLQRPGLATDPHNLDDFHCPLIDIPSVVKKRLRQQLQCRMPCGLLQSKIEGMASGLAAPAAPSATAAPAAAAPAPSAPSGSVRVAKPGDSVSKTKVKGQAYLSEEQLSEEEEFYRQHWAQRKQLRSRRPTAAAAPRSRLAQQVPPLPLVRRSSSNANDQFEDELDIHV